MEINRADLACAWADLPVESCLSAPAIHTRFPPSAADFRNVRCSAGNRRPLRKADRRQNPKGSRSGDRLLQTGSSLSARCA
jgi:hypothetical protein